MMRRQLKSVSGSVLAGQRMIDARTRYSVSFLFVTSSIYLSSSSKKLRVRGSSSDVKAAAIWENDPFVNYNVQKASVFLSVLIIITCPINDISIAVAAFGLKTHLLQLLLMCRIDLMVRSTFPRSEPFLSVSAPPFLQLRKLRRTFSLRSAASASSARSWNVFSNLSSSAACLDRSAFSSISSSALSRALLSASSPRRRRASGYARIDNL